MKGCLYCNDEVRARGLCNKHLMYVYLMIKKGDTSWKELEALGKALPSKTRRQQEEIQKFRRWLKDK